MIIPLPPRFSQQFRPHRYAPAPRHAPAHEPAHTPTLSLGLIASVLVGIALIWLFGGVLEEVLDNAGLVRWDRMVNSWFHTHATPGGLLTFDAITQLGTWGVWITVIATTVWLWQHGDRWLLRGWVLANVAGALLQAVLKTSIHRSRPQYAAPYLHGQSYSFPSGHTMGSTICYLLLVFVAATILEWPRSKQIVAYAIATVLIATIGFSRLYLGVHYPSDVIGGFAAGGVWVAACLTTFFAVQHRGRHRL